MFRMAGRRYRFRSLPLPSSPGVGEKGQGSEAEHQWIPPFHLTLCGVFARRRRESNQKAGSTAKKFFLVTQESKSNVVFITQLQAPVLLHNDAPLHPRQAKATARD